MNEKISRRKSREAAKISLRIVAVYAAVGAIWIFFSDKFVQVIADNPDEMVWFSILKGWFYVFATGGLLYILVSRGINQIRRSQEALLSAEAKYHQLVQSANSVILQMDPDGTIIFANEFARKYFGYVESHMIGKNIMGTIVPERDSSGRNVSGEIRDFLAHPELYPRLEFENIRSDGERVWIAWTHRAIRDADGGLEGILSIGNDITDRMRMQEEVERARDELEQRVLERTAELVNANERLREQASLLDLAHNAILVRDLDGRILFWNKGAEKTYGWTRAEALGQNIYSLLHTGFPQPLEEIMSGLLARSRWEGELHHVNREGKTLIVDSRWAVQTAPDGTPAAILEINSDITERRRAEEQLQIYMAKLQESNRALQDFAAIASHDLQEPLRKVISFGNMLKERYSNSLEPKGMDYLSRMLSATERMRFLLQALLDYSRVTSRGEPFREVELGAVVKEVLLDLEARAAETGGEVRVGDLPKVHADPTQMRQLFQNLIGNALKFHKEGEAPLVSVQSNSDGGRYVKIVIEDNGIGFEEKFLDQIFAPFQRLHGRTGKYEGTGMGLAICKKIVERHGGVITAKSLVGNGSTFIVTLPLEYSATL